MQFGEIKVMLSNYDITFVLKFSNAKRYILKDFRKILQWNSAQIYSA